MTHIVADLGFEGQSEGRGHGHAAGKEGGANQWQFGGRMARLGHLGFPALCFSAQGPGHPQWVSPPSHTDRTLGWRPDLGILPIFDLLGGLEEDRAEIKGACHPCLSYYTVGED